MRSSALALLTFASVTSQVAGTSIFARGDFTALFRRQTVCTSECAPFQSTLTACTTTACLCTSANAASLSTCANCYYQASPTPDVLTAANQLIDTFDQTCAGFTLPAVSVTTGVASATISSATGASSRSVSSTSRAVVTVTSVPGTISAPTATQVIVRPSSSTSSSDGSAATTTGSGSLPGLTSAATFAQAGVYSVVLTAFASLAVLAL